MWRYDVTVTRCVVGNVDLTDLGCPIRLLTSGDQLPSDRSSSTNCSRYTTSLCHHVAVRPLPQTWNYLGLFVAKPETYQLTINITYKGNFSAGLSAMEIFSLQLVRKNTIFLHPSRVD